MPKIFEWNGYRFFFFSNDGNPEENCHVHVRKGDAIAKFWILPYVSLDSAWGMNSRELRILEDKIYDNMELIKEKWDEFFSK